MKVMVLGMDGYLGWPLALHLTERGHEVSGIDNFMRRSWVTRMGSVSAIPIAQMPDRLAAFNKKFGKVPRFETIGMDDYPALCAFIESEQPDAIVHLAECPSAPYSMVGAHEAAFVMRNNVIGTLYLLHAIRDNAPDTHLVKLGTLGEYGTPDVDIPEGNFHFDYHGRTATNMPFPRKAGDWYHWSKVHDSMNVMWACEAWGLRSTDLMMGVVYGAWIDAMAPYDLGSSSGSLRTRLDFDEAFGTIINRFVCQAIIGHPLTIYGDVGKQTRGYLPIHDAMQCMTLVVENPPKQAGEYRVFNQFAETYSVLELAQMVAKVGFVKYDLDVRIGHYEPPRIEAQEHYYNPAHVYLEEMGYVPDTDLEGNIALMMASLVPYRDRILEHHRALWPSIRWDGKKGRVRLIGERVFGDTSGKSKVSLGLDQWKPPEEE